MDPRRRWVYEPSSLLTGILMVTTIALLAAVLPLPNTAAVTGGLPPAAAGIPASPTAPGATTPGSSSEPGAAHAPTGNLAQQRDGTVTPPEDGSADGLPGSTVDPGDAPSVGPPPAGPDTGGVTYQGVTADAVLWGTAAQKNGCGGFDQSQIAGAYGIQSNHEVNYQLAVEYFNTYPLVDFPLPPEVREHVNPENGYWGRRIETVFRDSGGFACQDVGRANAVRMAEEDKVFGLIMPTNDGPEVPMSLVMAQHQLIHIGRWMTGPVFWNQRAPYFYDGRWGDYVSQNLALGSWVCRDWVGQPATDTGDLRVNGLPRVLGIPFPDVPDFREATGVLQQELRACGVEAQEYAIPFDLSTLAANTQTVVSRMIADGVTTILSVNTFLDRMLLMEAATNQNWHPEWVLSGLGNGAFPGTYTTFMTPDQAANTWAAADNASIVEPSYYESEPYLAFKRIRPDEEPDDAWAHHYYQFRLLALGLAGAGPTLTPETFGDGLRRLCSPCPRQDPLLPYKSFGPGEWTDLQGFTLVKWNPDKPCEVCKPDSNGNPPRGYFDFLEDGKRYLLRITDPDMT